MAKDGFRFDAPRRDLSFSPANLPMNRRQVLLPIYRALRPIVDRLRLNSVARPIWALLWRGRDRSMIRATQNGRAWWLAPDVALGGETYEAETITWLRGVLKPGMTAVDVGANVGQISLEMAQLVGPTGRVVAIEPSPGNVRFLRAHVAANGFNDRVIVVEAACSAGESGELVLEVASGDLDSIQNGPQLKSLGLKRNPLHIGKPSTEVRVLTRSLDSLCDELGLSVDVLKVDVEGAEVEVFSGARACLSRFRPRIIFGFHPFAFENPAGACRELKNLFANSGLFVENDAGTEGWTLKEYTVSPWSK
jgi:FkbM family methyltransferase